jgi:4-amino-4-deoxy-L-arabinose transferase-like glycosyltransferase
MTHRRTLWIFLAVFATLLFVDAPGSWLFDPDEARYAEIPMERLASGDFLTPRLNGSNYFEKPPLLYWLNAGLLHIGGNTPYMARLVSRLATAGTAALLLFLEGVPATAGLWAALIYLSSLLPFVMGRINTIDPLITFALTFTLMAFRSFVRARARGGPAGTALSVFGVGLALGMLAKGLIGVVLPGIVVCVWCAITGAWPRLREIIFSRATPLLILIAGPWFVMMERAHSGFNYFFFVHEHLMRFATDSAHRPGSNF